jgi:hypothetical protein
VAAAATTITATNGALAGISNINNNNNYSGFKTL